VGALGVASILGLAWTIVSRPGPLTRVEPAPVVVHRGEEARAGSRAGHPTRPAPTNADTTIATEEPAPVAEEPSDSVLALTGAPARSAPKSDAGLLTKKININTASAAELELLPGIGPALAGRIVEHRSQHGRFTSVDRLDDVKGIGPAKLAKIRELVRVE